MPSMRGYGLQPNGRADWMRPWIRAINRTAPHGRQLRRKLGFYPLRFQYESVFKHLFVSEAISG
jgi:hypothetical protein